MSMATEPRATQETSVYAEEFERLAARRGGDRLLPTRRRALERFRELGFPTRRMEDWRFTGVSEIASVPFRPAGPEARQPHPEEAAPYFIEGCAARLVFVNGRLAPGLSRLPSGPPGLIAGSLTELAREGSNLAQSELFRLAPWDDEAFTALNTAFFEDGAFLQIAPGFAVSEPIHLLFLTKPGEIPLMTHPRVLVVAGDRSQVEVIEDHASLGDGIHFTNSVTEITAGDGAVLTHTFLARESTGARHIATTALEQGRNASVSAHSALLGGALVRNNARPVLAGEGGECLLNGLFMGTGDQHLDNYMRVVHAAPHCDSRQFYYGVLDGRAHGVFHGRIVVQPEAQQTNAKQTNRNLLLSPDARMDTKPQLEIFADDVKCTHGATIGQMDDEAVFYLRTRGIAGAEARALLLRGFAGQSLDRMKEGPARETIAALVEAWFR